MHELANEPAPWWGTVTLDEYEGGKWQIGPSTIWIYRSSHDWRVIHRPSADPGTPDPMVRRSEVTVPIEEEAMRAVLESEDADLVTHRYSMHRTGESVAVRPALADRPVVSRPEHPLSVMPDEAVTLYLSTPLWVQIKLLESDRLLTECRSYRMSDTWFGSSTRDGELCYATRTAGRLHLDRVPLRLHRALTPLRVQNRAPEPLALERVQLPTPHLSLYVTPDHAVWTERVTMTHRETGQGASIQIKDGAPKDIDDAEQIQDPRETSKRGLITSTFSAFGALFGP